MVVGERESVVVAVGVLDAVDVGVNVGVEVKVRVGVAVGTPVGVEVAVGIAVYFGHCDAGLIR